MKQTKDKICRVCNRKEYAKGWCRHHYDYLRYRKCDLDNLKECFEYLKAEKSKTIRCLYCGERATHGGFCEKHYNILKDKNIDLTNFDMCIETLTKEEKKPPNVLNMRVNRKGFKRDIKFSKKKCMYCDKEATCGTWCSTDYFYLYKRFIDRKDILACRKELYKRDIRKGVL